MINQETSIQHLDVYRPSFWSLDKETKEAALASELSKIQFQLLYSFYHSEKNIEPWTKFSNSKDRLNALSIILDSKKYCLDGRVLSALVKDLIHEIFSSDADNTQRIGLLNLLARSPGKDLYWSISYKEFIKPEYTRVDSYPDHTNSLSKQGAFKLIYDSTQSLDGGYSPIEIAAQHCNINFLTTILKIKYNFFYIDPTNDLERKLENAFRIILTSNEIDYVEKSKLTKVLDYLQSFYFSGLETRLLASLKRQIWERSQIEPGIKVGIDMYHYGINGNDTGSTSCYDYIVSFLPSFSSHVSNTTIVNTAQRASHEYIPVACPVYEVDFAEGQPFSNTDNTKLSIS